MKEMRPEPGERIDLAVDRLCSLAPAFMVFNGIRVEAAQGEAAQAIYDRWNEAVEKRQREYEATKDQAVMVDRRHYDMLVVLAERCHLPLTKMAESLILAAKTRLDAADESPRTSHTEGK